MCVALFVSQTSHSVSVGISRCKRPIVRVSATWHGLGPWFVGGSRIGLVSLVGGHLGAEPPATLQRWGSSPSTGLYGGVRQDIRFTMSIWRAVIFDHRC